MRDIAVCILNNSQYLTIKNGIDKLIELGYSVDVICPLYENDNTGFNDMFEDTITKLKEKYNVFNYVPDYEYKILLEPYPSIDVKHKYRMKYHYSLLSAKPSVVYLPDNYIVYDAILCTSEFDASYLSAYGKTHIIGNLKDLNFKRKKHGGKPNLLYLPTYGKGSSIDNFPNNLGELKDKYNVIVKIHHGTKFLKDENYRIQKIKECCDELYDSDKPLYELMEVADIVLTDMSGSLYDALYLGIPVAIFAEDINVFKIGDFNTIQHQLVNEKIVPYTNDPSKIRNIITEAISKHQHDIQLKWSQRYLNGVKNPVENFVNTITNYLNDDINERYFQLHCVLRESFINKDKEINSLNSLNLQLTESNIELYQEQKKLEEKINFYETSRLHKLVDKIYEIKNKISKRGRR